MTKHFHITINEGATLVRRRGAHPPTSQFGSDPGYDYVVPPPEDPDYPYVVPVPEDPGYEYVVPPPEDPDYPYVVPIPEDPSGGSAQGWPMAGQVAGVVYASQGPEPAACGCCCGTDSKTTTPPRPGLTPRDYSGFVIVRMAQGLEMDYPTLWHLAGGEPGFPALKAVLELELKRPEGEEKMRRPEPVVEDPEIKRPVPAEPPPGALVSRPLIELESGGGGRKKELLPRGETLTLLEKLEGKAALSAFPPLHSLRAYWRVDLRPYPERVEEVVAALNALAEVDLAYRELTANDPGVAGSGLAEDQGYLEDAPAGISAYWAQSQLIGVTSALRVCDLEQGWRPEHLDLQATVSPLPIYGANRASNAEGGDGSPGHHGTAVLGQLAATGSGVLSVKGAATQLGTFLMASHYKSKLQTETKGTPPVTSLHPFAGTNGHVAAAVVQALISPTSLAMGDVLLLEVQRGLRPTEIDPADLDAIRLASALGVVVVEAAGNGGFDLDAYVDPDTGLSLRRGDSRFRDSGAILVGASRSAVPHHRAPFSNYGSRLDCYAWGEAVTSCGYGDLAGTTDTDLYTNTFSGTSSASPIIAGAAALVQALHKHAAGSWLAPLAMRSVLSDPATGTPQGPNVAGFIGVMPDLKAIVRGQLQLVPDVYLRRHVCDDGSRRAPSTEVSSSPDILLWDGTSPTGLPADPAVVFGEGPRANQPAPGTPFEVNAPQKLLTQRLLVRLRNRGGAAGEARVQLFASPAATLITAERWAPVAEVSKIPINPGDTLMVGEANSGWTTSLKDLSKIHLKKLMSSAVAESPWVNVLPPLSFLAIERPGPPANHPWPLDASLGLPPAPPYFDWTEYRAFLHGRSVAWRNSYAISVGSALPLKLAFLIAGTPDHARHFDLEVIQRLPAGASAHLQVPPALAAKLRQRQTLLGAGPAIQGSKAANLTLPRRPRFTVSTVRLAPGACIPACFELPTGSTKLAHGHSLAIRQLWKGEEVGRITWWFVDPAKV